MGTLGVQCSPEPGHRDFAYAAPVRVAASKEALKHQALSLTDSNFADDFWTIRLVEA
jgi:hypothetical protein